MGHTESPQFNQPNVTNKPLIPEKRVKAENRGGHLAFGPGLLVHRHKKTHSYANTSYTQRHFLGDSTRVLKGWCQTSPNQSGHSPVRSYNCHIRRWTRTGLGALIRELGSTMSEASLIYHY